MLLRSIHVYPLKGARGVALDRADVLRGGLRNDRRFMLLGADGTFITQRSHPRLALVQTSITHDSVVLAGVTVPLAPRGEPRRVVVWDDEVDALVVEGDASRAISEHLGERCTLVFMPDDVERAVEAPYGRPGDRVGFADAYPLLLASLASLADLNARLPSPVPMDRFRPNLVVDGDRPFAEEDHAAVRVGALTFRMPKRCSRCPVVTIDQATAAQSKEPLKTLATYRAVNNKVYFAQNVIPDAEGSLAVGDGVIWIP